MLWNTGVSVSEVLFKQTFRYLIDRYFGKYVQKLSGDQLSLSWGEKSGKAEKVLLKLEALNDISEQYNLPLEFLYCFIESVSLPIPRIALLNDNIVIEAHGLNIVVQPKHCFEDVSMFDSMLSSMTTNIQLAEELQSKLEMDACQGSPSNGIESFARAINTVFSKVKIKLVDALIRIENAVENSTSGVALEIKIHNLEYFDEAGVEDSTQNISCGEKNLYEPLSYSVKRFIIDGLSLYTDQFSSTSRAHYNQNFDLSGHDKILIPGSPEMPPTHCALSSITFEDEELDSDPILISRLIGKQNITLKLKQNEALNGPKVDVEFNFGALNFYLSPHQVHILSELTRGLAKPDANEESLRKRHILNTNKPMKEDDFALVEQELQRQQENPEVPSRSVQNCRGWSSHPLDESDEEFHPLPTENRASAEYYQASPDLDTSCSSIGSETRSSISDSHSTSSSRKHIKSKGSNVQALLQDSLSDLTQFRATCSSICVIILHEDFLKTMDSSYQTSRTSVLSNQSLKTQSEAFFDSSSILEWDFKDLNAVKNSLSLSCQANHLRIMATAVTLEGNEKSSSSQRIFQATVSAVNVEVLECLFNSSSKCDQTNLEPQYTEILSLKTGELKTAEKIAIKWDEPLFKVQYQQTDFLSQPRIPKLPTSKLEFYLGPFKSEIDISIVDRIHCLLNPQPVFCKKENVQESLFNWREENCRVKTISNETEIYLSSPFASLNLRFPIPDKRPLHDMDRVPWWQQNLYKEVLCMELFDASLFTIIDTEQLQKKIEIQCRDFHALFLDSPLSDPISFLRVSVDPKADCSECNGFNWPRFVLQAIPPSSFSLLESDFVSENENGPPSIADALLSQLGKESSPFASNPVVYGTKFFPRDQSFGDADGKADANSEDHEIIMPAEKEKIQEFIAKTVDRSQYIFDCNLPLVQLFLPDKPFFELLFNRLSNDLVLWTAASLTSVHSYDASGFKVHPPGLGLNVHALNEQISSRSFQTFTSDCNNESDSEDHGMHYSFSEHSKKSEYVSKKLSDRDLTKFTVSLNIKKGTAIMHAPVRDESKNMHQNLCGKLQFNIEDCIYFMASSYKGDPHQSYICILSNKGTLLHKGNSTYPSTSSCLQSSINACVDNLQPTIYCSEPGVPLKRGLPIGKGDEVVDMLTIAIHMANDGKEHIKTIKMAAGINGATLRHYMCLEKYTWLTQFTDFLNVDTFPISGYSPPKVVTEMHFHFTNCSVDYRPLYLPLRAFVTAESFSLASNVSAAPSSLLLRIISEELCIFLSQNTSATSVDLKKDYVCVIDTGLIDIAFKRGAGVQGTAKDLYATNNIIHIRTCADSCKALQNLVMYLASDGDFAVQPTCLKEHKVNKTSLEEPCTEKPAVSELQNDAIHNLMAEAMKDCSFFEEGRGMKNMKMSDINFNAADEEFCVLDDDPGVGVLPKSGEPQIRVLTNETIVIIDNYFAIPVGRSDMLKAPKHFPTPQQCYTFHETTVVWHIYGGRDFPEKKGSKKKSVKINKEGYKDSALYVEFESDHFGNKYATFCNGKLPSKNFELNSVTHVPEHCGLQNQKFPSSKSHTWLSKGGPSRDHDVLMELQMNKVRFRHERYAEDSEYASRDVLLIQDIEIRDRLASSKIHKFLYQYVTDSIPRQSNANMIAIKALYTRPDVKHATEECSLRVSLKPLRLNIDQDTLMFACKFFGEICGMDTPEVVAEPSPQKVNLFSTPGATTEGKEFCHKETIPHTVLNQGDKSGLTFFRSFAFSPDVPIKLDYEGKRTINTAQGTLQGIFMGLAQLNNSTLSLKRLTYRHGLLGWGKLVQYVIDEWFQDIKANQLQSILGGIGPLPAVVELINGLVNLVWYPVEAYRKDGQIVRGIQRGASSFSTSTVMALIELTSRLIDTIQSAAEFAYDMVSPSSTVTHYNQNNTNPYRRSSQPADVREGIAAAYTICKEGMEDTARALVRAVSEEHRGVHGSMGGTLRELVPCLLSPVIHSAEAANTVLDGVKNQLNPEVHREAVNKWRTSNI